MRVVISCNRLLCLELQMKKLIVVPLIAIVSLGSLISIRANSWTCGSQRVVMSWTVRSMNDPDSTNLLWKPINHLGHTCDVSKESKSVDLISQLHSQQKPTETPDASIDDEAQMVTLARVGIAAFNSGQLALAITKYQAAILFARKLHDKRNEGALLNNMGEAYIAEGQDSQELETLTLALAIAHEVGNRQGEGVTLSTMAEEYK